MTKPNILLILAGALLLTLGSAQAQPPPVLLGNGDDGPRGAPMEREPGSYRDINPLRDPRDTHETRESRQQRAERYTAQYRFKADESQAIREWYRDREPPSPGMAGGQRELPPGLQRKLDRGGELPPGWQRKVERGEVLSQEQVRHGRRPSDDLLGRLPRQPEGTVILETEDQVIRVLEATGEVLDVLGVGRER